jgi:hypothetical protein
MSEQEQSARTHIYAAAVAGALGTGWTYAPNRDGNGYLPRYATIAGPDGASLHVSNEYQTGRFEWSGNYPRDAQGHDHKPYHATRPRITTSADKSPGQAARDITRRLLPAYLDLLKQCQESVAAANAYVDTTARNVARIADVLGVSPPLSPSSAFLRFYWNGGDTYGDVTVNGTSVQINVKLPLAQAERLLADLRNANFPERPR